MTIRRIRTFGDPILRRKADAIDTFDGAVERLVADLTDTLVESNGSGLAAPQIGVGLRAFVFVAPGERSREVTAIRHIVNPVLVEQDEELIDDEEGCLSIPGLAYDLPRPRRIVATGWDIHGEPLRIEGTERLARCLAHETDHLDGILFVDRLDPERRKQAMRDIRRMLLEGEDVQVKTSPHTRPL
jgi:peptide deformylase